MVTKRFRLKQLFRAGGVAWLLLLLFITPLFQNCAKRPLGIPQPLYQIGLSSEQVKNRLVDQYNHWRGVPYRNGGQSRQGIDCSAFVQLTYRDQFNLQMPRTTSQQSAAGHQVSASRLRSGDLVLFKTGWGERHVGIYLEKNDFMHVSKSRGVMVSSITEPYWQKRFWQARRVFN